jgi:hypothetical protein
MLKERQEIMSSIKQLFGFVVVYPVMNIFYFSIYIINLFVLRESTKRIIVVVLIYYCMSHLTILTLQHVSGNLLARQFVESVPCLGLVDGCHTMKLTIVVCVVSFPLLYWNNNYLFGTGECIDYPGMLDEIKEMMIKLNKIKTEDKIDRTLDAADMTDRYERQHIKQTILALKKPRFLKKIEDKITRLRENDTSAPDTLHGFNKKIEKKYIKKLSSIKSLI